MSDDRWLEGRVQTEVAEIPLPPRQRWSPQNRPGLHRALVFGFAAVVIALAIGTGLRTLRDERTLVASAPAFVTTSPRPALAEAPAASAAVDVEVRKVLSTLTFRPLVPEASVTSDPVVARVLAACGLAPECLEIAWDVVGPPTGRVLVLQGPAGCCLDGARPNAVRDVEIRPGVLAQYVPVQPQFGGPILWWTDTSSGDALYVAISSPMGTRDSLTAIARSMRPLAPAGFQNGRCNTGPADDRARSGDYVFLTTGLIDAQNEFLSVAKRGVGPADQVRAELGRLDQQGSVSLPPVSSALHEGRIVFRLPVYKPAGSGCWRVTLVDGSATATYVVEVREPPTSLRVLPICPPRQIPVLDVSLPPPPGDQPGSGAASADAAFRARFPNVSGYILYPFGSDRPVSNVSDLGAGPVWIVVGGDTYIALAPGAPGGSNNWFAYRARFVGCRTA